MTGRPDQPVFHTSTMPCKVHRSRTQCSASRDLWRSQVYVRLHQLLPTASDRAGRGAGDEHEACTTQRRPLGKHQADPLPFTSLQNGCAGPPFVHATMVILATPLYFREVKHECSYSRCHIAYHALATLVIHKRLRDQKKNCWTEAV